MRGAPPNPLLKEGAPMPEQGGERGGTDARKGRRKGGHTTKKRKKKGVSFVFSLGLQYLCTVKGGGHAGAQIKGAGMLAPR